MNQRRPYLVGSKRGSGGPTNLINKSEDTVVVVNEALVGVMIRFICENPRSASLEKIGIVLRAIFKGSSLSGTLFSVRYSRYHGCVFNGEM